MKRQILCLAAMLLTGCGSAIEQTAPIAQTEEVPTEKPTQAPTEKPAQVPTEKPTQAPTEKPTQAPTDPPTEAPTQAPVQGEDTQPPVFLHTSTVQLVTGTPFDPWQELGFGDDLDPVPQVSWGGYLDVTQPGSYPVTVTLMDSAGNTNARTVEVLVQDSFETPPDTKTRIAFGDFKAQHGGEGRLVGIDVSKWQGDIDFEAVREAGCDFVIMRIGSAGDGPVMDEYYLQNMERARAAGLRVGVYLNTSGVADADAVRAAADWVADVLQGAPLDLPIGYDWESFSGFQRYGLSFADLTALYRSFEEQMAGHGYPSMLYGSRFYLENAWDPAGTPVWTAEYADVPTYAGSFLLWQGSDCGRIPGIAGDVDLDVWYAS